jgi:hypothetical protein
MDRWPLKSSRYRRFLRNFSRAALALPFFSVVSLNSWNLLIDTDGRQWGALWVESAQAQTDEGTGDPGIITDPAGETRKLLVSPDARGKNTDQDPKAKKADDYAKSVAGSKENSQALYELSAEIFSRLEKQANGDPEKLQKLMIEAARNPAAFGETFTPEERKKLKEVSDRSPHQQQTGATNPAP